MRITTLAGLVYVRLIALLGHNLSHLVLDQIATIPVAAHDGVDVKRLVKLRGQPLHAHVNLEKGERSELAALASELL